MSDYTIAAIPTMYRGRKYRSRLEARWAAFFDLLEWRHEYEPFDFGKWSPDFSLIREPVYERLGDDPGLVEIKPIDGFDETVAHKMRSAAKDRAFKGPLFLFGAAPRKLASGFVQLGWQGNHWADYDKESGRHSLTTQRLWWTPAHLHWLRDPDKPSFVADILDCSPHIGGRVIVGFHTPCANQIEALDYAAHTMELWARATNAVQYQPGART